MKKKLFIFFFSIFLINTNSSFSNEIDIYKKIDLFSEVLEKINKEKLKFINFKKVNISSSKLKKI